MKNTSRKVALAGLGAMVAANSAQAFTTLTNDAFAGNNNDLNSTWPNYGDNVAASGGNNTVGVTNGITGTPDITLAFTAGEVYHTYTAWDGRGNVVQLEDIGAVDPFEIIFTPATGFGVEIISFDLDEWAGGGDTSVDWEISGGASGTLANGTWNDFNTANDPGDGGGRSTISPNAPGQFDEALTLQLSYQSGAGSYLAMDNLTFAQVPEPSAAALVGLGALGAAALRGRRR